jgi:hypothetical protein
VAGWTEFDTGIRVADIAGVLQRPTTISSIENRNPMDLIAELIGRASAFARPHLLTIATSFTLVLLVIFGDDINGALKKRVRHYPFLVRMLSFVILCTFGYGLLTIWLTPLLARAFLSLGDRYLAPVVVAAFMGLGMLAERKKYM